MGLTHIKATIANPTRPRQTARVRFLIDPGVAYSDGAGPSAHAS
jgi:hypothetical protein